jgi:DNA-binding transcriptional LysR family regulator
MADEIPLSLRQLQYFIVVAEAGSITRAAERLLVSQPSLSHQLRALEATLGAVLFDRHPRGVVLTPVGRALLPGARSALNAAEDARRSVKKAAGLEAGELRIATSLSLALGVLPHALREWFAAHPEIEVTVHEQSHIDLVEAKLVSGEADVALAQHPVGWPGPVYDLGEEDMVVIVAHGDPLAQRTSGRITIGDLRERRWVLPAVSDGFAQYIEVICAAAGFVPEAAVRSSGVGTLVALAASGLGPTIVPANAVPEHIPGAVLMLEPPIRRRIAVYATLANDALARAFLSCARSSPLAPEHLAPLLDEVRGEPAIG